MKGRVNQTRLSCIATRLRGGALQLQPHLVLFQKLLSTLIPGIPVELTRKVKRMK